MLKVGNSCMLAQALYIGHTLAACKFSTIGQIMQLYRHGQTSLLHARASVMVYICVCAFVDTGIPLCAV